jgi:DNA topoisomerase IA
MALRIIVDKENERNQFKPEEYWTILLIFFLLKKKFFNQNFKINIKI